MGERVQVVRIYIAVFWPLVDIHHTLRHREDAGNVFAFLLFVQAVDDIQVGHLGDSNIIPGLESVESVQVSRGFYFLTLN